MFEILKSERFNVMLSFLIGLAALSILKPVCKDGCRIHKAPSIKEIQSSTYQLGAKCYQFTPTATACPNGGGVIEAFQRSRA